MCICVMQCYVFVLKVIIQNDNLSFTLKIEIDLTFNIFLLVGCNTELYLCNTELYLCNTELYLCNTELYLCNTELHGFIHKEIMDK